MSGKQCVAIASDTRYGVQNVTLASNKSKIYEINEKVYIGMSGLATDMQTLYQKFRFHTNLYKLREERDISPKVFSNFVSTTLYEARFGPWFVEPVVAGLDADDEPYISAMDLIGAPLLAKDCVLAGTCSEALYGMSETLYQENQDADDLFETISQALLASVNRDAFSGWGAIVHMITPDEVITKHLKGRQD